MNELLADLHAKGLPGRTLVVLGIELGRTPRINEDDGQEPHTGETRNT